MTTRTAVQRRAHARGLTLIELLIVVAIVGILIKLAMPSYTEHVKRAHRSNAKATALKVAQFMERAATASGAYPAATAVPSALLTVQGGRYTASVTSTAVSFTVTAQRTTGTAQADDRCGDFVLQHTGATSITNAATTATAADCWAR